MNWGLNGAVLVGDGLSGLGRATSLGLTGLVFWVVLLDRSVGMIFVYLLCGTRKKNVSSHEAVMFSITANTTESWEKNDGVLSNVYILWTFPKH